MKKLTLVTEEEFKKLELKDGEFLNKDSILYTNDKKEMFLVSKHIYQEVGKTLYDVAQLTNNINDICELCISKGMPILLKNRYCTIDGKLKTLEGKYRSIAYKVHDDDENERDYVFHCTFGDKK
jgi:hypothetical protein